MPFEAMEDIQHRLAVSTGLTTPLVASAFDVVGVCTVFDLAVVEELPYLAIAEALEIPVGTVKSRMHSAVARVRAALKERDRVEDALRTRRGSAGGEMRV